MASFGNVLSHLLACSLMAGETWARLRSHRQISVAHIISPLPGRDLEQSAVLQSYANAKAEAEQGSLGDITLTVSIIAVQVAGEVEVPLPSGIQRAPPLNRTTASEYGCKRQIPFPADLMRTLQAEAPDATFHMLSNVDVGVVPDFYRWMVEENKETDQAVDVLKVMIPSMCDGKFLGLDLPRTYEMVSNLPQTHPGHDMFMWPGRHTPMMIQKTGDVFLGYAPVGTVIKSAMEAQPGGMKLLQGYHVTFHFGREGEHGRGDPDIVPLKPVPGCTYDHPDGSLLQVGSGDCDYQALNDENAIVVA